jgi:peptidoglycan/xylan/chitin deacetylase (PgdA/CDA1 family)
LYSLETLIKKTDHNVILPFYHSVSDSTPLHIKNLYTSRSVQQFKDDLDFLLDNYEPITLQQLIALSHTEKETTENYFHLSFDDGLSEFYTIVAPILKERNISATVFLNSDFIDNKNLFYRFKASLLYEKLKDTSLLSLSYQQQKQLDELAEKHEVDFNAYLLEQKPYLTSNQIKELIEQDFTFGAHSIDHPLYKELSFDEQMAQTKESLNFIQKQFNLPYRVFSFPFTDDGVGVEFFDAIKDKVDLSFGCAGIKDDSVSNHLQRIPMEQDKSAKDIIKEEYLYYLMKQKVGKHKITRK